MSSKAGGSKNRETLLLGQPESGRSEPKVSEESELDVESGRTDDEQMVVRGRKQTLEVGVLGEQCWESHKR